MEKPAELADRLREHGLRVTPQRRAILAAFESGASGHLTADEVFERARRQLPELARATVYNVLGEFVRAGLLQSVEGLGPQRFDPNLDETHHHFRCDTCGQLFDVHPQGAEKVRLPENGFKVSKVQILLEGTCPGCAEKAA